MNESLSAGTKTKIAKYNRGTRETRVEELVHSVTTEKSIAQ